MVNEDRNFCFVSQTQEKHFKIKLFLGVPLIAVIVAHRGRFLDQIASSLAHKLIIRSLAGSL